MTCVARNMRALTMQNRNGKQNSTPNEALVGEEEAYERARQEAMTLMDKGFHLGGDRMVTRKELHVR